MKRALQAILIAGEEMKQDVLDGKKKITIREGRRDYSDGPVLIGCHELNWATMREISNVRYASLKDVPEEDYRDDGFDSKADMLMALSKFYPDINWDSPVTIIRWE